ncbi:MAG: HAD family hydrolase [Nitrososphaerota archaeon]|nr:HAD family hydrolase [Nitrososphaerota archaeon]
MGTTGVMFDWDGVLIDSLGSSFNVYNKIFAKLGLRQLTKDEFLEFQSPNWYDFYRKIGVPERFWKQADDDWLKLYDEEKPDLHPDALGCLTALKGRGFSLALISNGSKDRITEELERLKVRPYFDSVEFGTRKEHLKPSPYMLDKTLATLGINPVEAVYVGDSPADIQAAKNAGVPAIALARGPIQAQRLRAEGPDHIFGGLEEMTGFLTNGAALPSR